MSDPIFAYCSAMAQARRMMCDGIITPDDYERIDAIMLQKYNLPFSSIYRDMDLIISAIDGNMPLTKGG